MRSKISVIMSVFNGGKYINESIDSILNQSFRNFEFIIVNDCSTDNSLEIVKDYAKKDKRIKIIENKKNLGLTKSLNKALKIAEGEYIARQDADDISLPERFELQISFLDKHPNVFLLGTNSFLFYENYKFISGTVVCGVRKNQNKLPKNNYMLHSSIMFRNDKKTFYREKFYQTQDFDLYLNILSRGLNIDNLEKPLVSYRVVGTGISSTKNAMQNFFGKKAKEFYYQRMKFGKDQYASFNPKKELAKIKKQTDKINKNYDGTRFLIDLMIYSNKKECVKLIYKNRKVLSKKYVIKKLILLLLPRRLMKFQKEMRGQYEIP